MKQEILFLVLVGSEDVFYKFTMGWELMVNDPSLSDMNNKIEDSTVDD